MPHSPSQKPETRKRILKSARHLFNRRGLAGVTIDEIMADAGLTRGGFYKHFATKKELYAEAIAQFNCDDAEPWWDAHVDRSTQGLQRAKMIVSAYLSKEHFEDRDGSCPMVGLPSDAARAGDEGRHEREGHERQQQPLAPRGQGGWKKWHSGIVGLRRPQAPGGRKQREREAGQQAAQQRRAMRGDARHVETARP